MKMVKSGIYDSKNYEYIAGREYIYRESPVIGTTNKRYKMNDYEKSEVRRIANETEYGTYKRLCELKTIFNSARDNNEYNEF